MSKYEKIDAAIVEAIKQGCREFVDVWGSVRELCVDANRMNPDRVLDRRLQALRKAGKIRFARGSRATGGGWVLAD